VNIAADIEYEILVTPYKWVMVTTMIETILLVDHDNHVEVLGGALMG